MKTIAVLTDLSERSEHAATYALHIAAQIKADVLLFNAFLMPSDIPMAAAQVAWPAYEYDELKTDSEKSLKKLCDKLKHEAKATSSPGAYIPAIAYRCEEGPVVNTLSLLEEDKNIVLLVAGTHSTDAITTFALGNNCTELIDETKLPLLLVPENATFTRLEKLIFATDLNKTDVNYINSVSGLAKAFAAHVMIANVNPETGTDIKHNQSENALMQEMVLNVKYKRISYHNIPDENVKKGLVQLLINEKPDILVMVHRKSSLLDFSLNRALLKRWPLKQLFHYWFIHIR